MKYAVRVLLIVAAAVSSPALAAGEGAHACTSADLVNKYWRLVDFNETPALREDSWYRMAPHQYITFYEDSSYSYLASDHDIKSPAELRKMLDWPEQSGHVLHFLLSDTGVLDLYDNYNKKNILKYRYSCIISETKNEQYHKGDLVLTGYSRRGGTQIWGRSQIYRLYRRWF